MMGRVERKWRDYSAIAVLALVLCAGLLLSSGVYPVGWDSLGVYAYLGWDLAHSWTWIWYSSWTPVFAYGVGGSTFSLFSLFELFFVGLFGLAGLKLFVFALTVLAGISIYELCYRHTRSSLAALSASVVYLFNRNFCDHLFGGTYSALFGIAIFPVALLAVDDALERKTTGRIVLASLLLSVFVGASHLVALFMFSLVLSAYLVWRLLVSAHLRGVRRSVAEYGKVIAKIVALVVLFSFPVIVSMVLTISPQLEAGALGGRSLSTFFLSESSGSLFDALTLRGVPYQLYWEFLPEYYFVFVCVPVVAFLSLLSRRDSFSLFLAGCSLVSIFLAKGVSPPMPEIYQWLYAHVPFFYGAAHRASMWLMVTSFGYAVLVGMSVHSIYDRLAIWSREAISSAAGVRWPSRRTVYRRIISGFLVFVILLVAFSNPFLGLSYRFTAFSLPKPYQDAYGWLADQPGDGVVLAVPFTSPYGRYSFISPFPVMDLRQLIPAVTGRSVVASTGNRVGQYYDFLAFVDHAIRGNKTNNLMKILGPFDIRYVAVLPNSPASYLEFFNEQTGLRLVYRNENVSILQNEYWTPVVFPATHNALVVGGYDVFTAMARFDSFELRQWALVFANQIGTDQLTSEIIKAEAVVLGNVEPLDLAMLLLTDSVSIEAADYSSGFADPLHEWISTSDWVQQGELVLSNQLLYTSGNVSVSIPVNFGRNELYDVYARVLCGPHAGHLSFDIDQRNVGDITPFTRDYSGLRWTAVGSLTVPDGKHLLTVKTSGGESGIDEVAFVVPGSLRNMTRMLEDATQDKVVLQILEGREMFKWAPMQHYADWRASPKKFDASNGVVANATTSAGGGQSWIPLNVTVMRHGSYGLAVRVLTGPSCGRLSIRVDNASMQSFDLARAGEERFEWVTLNESLRLREGAHTFELFAEAGKVEIDQLALYSGTREQVGMSFADLLRSDGDNGATVTYEMVNPTEYKIHVRTTVPIFLVLSQGYDSQWKAEVKGHEEAPWVVYSMFNGFYLNKTGDFDVELKYAGQQIYTLVWTVSGVLMIAVLTLTLLLKSRSNLRGSPRVHRKHIP